MAAPAETIQFEQTRAAEIVEPVARHHDADFMLKLLPVRLEARAEAEMLMDRHMQFLRDGEWDLAPLPVDALGTAHKLIDVGKRFGGKSREYNEHWSGLVHDCWRLFGEAYRKNSWEYFPPAFHNRDTKTGDYHSDGQSLTEIVTGGLSPMAEPGEKPLRIDDYVEEMTYRAIGGLGLSETVSVQTVLECPEWAIEAYKVNQKRAYYGYVPSAKKLMLRGMKFPAMAAYRIEEQLALRGDFITHEVIVAVLEETRRIEPGTQLTKTELHGKQFIDTEGGDVIELAEALDCKATELSGKNIFMGEEISAGYVKDYGRVKVEAHERRVKLRAHSEKLAWFVFGLAQNNTDRWVAEGLVSNFVDKTLKKESEHNPELAEIIFDQKTADGYREVAKLRAEGRHAEAEQRLEEVEEEAPPISYCGADSCGLKAVSMTSPEAQRGRDRGLKGEQLRDTERPCPKCGELTVHYDTKGSKACTNPDCDAVEIRH